MVLTISWTELLSWIFTVISLVLFILERKKNKPYYMAMQGILRALHQKAGFYASRMSALKDRSGNTVSKDEYALLIESVYVDYQSLKENVMGVMKAIEPDKDLPFDTTEFIKKP
jgi:hypothetical protein